MHKLKKNPQRNWLWIQESRADITASDVGFLLCRNFSFRLLVEWLGMSVVWTVRGGPQLHICRAVYMIHFTMMYSLDLYYCIVRTTNIYWVMCIDIFGATPIPRSFFFFFSLFGIVHAGVNENSNANAASEQSTWMRWNMRNHDALDVCFVFYSVFVVLCDHFLCQDNIVWDMRGYF